jgi:hypothetical protein
MPVYDGTPESQLAIEKVTQFMLHNHSGGVNGCLDKKGKCRRHYDDMKIGSTYFNDKGYVVYGRGSDDLRVVPHNVEILLDWDGHINVEYASSTYSMMYLYKYIFKGAKKVKATIIDKSIFQDERTFYIRGRKLCSNDAVWRFLGYQTYPKSRPGVKVYFCSMIYAYLYC